MFGKIPFGDVVWKENDATTQRLMMDRWYHRRIDWYSVVVIIALQCLWYNHHNHYVVTVVSSFQSVLVVQQQQQNPFHQRPVSVLLRRWYEPQQYAYPRTTQLPTTTTTTRAATTRIPTSLASSSVEPPPPPPSSSSSSNRALIGDDAAYFDMSQQTITKWIQFTLATTTVLALIAYVWVLPFGLHGGDQFVQFIQHNDFISTTTDPATTVTIMLSIFAVCHSGMAGLRTYVEPIIGARTWRVLFAVVSLPLALSCISYFINHAHDGIHYWDVTHIPGIHTLLYIANFISFLFLYPSTFNLLEIAAIEPPQLHLWETGIIRITRHPQAMGQILWCVAHTLWLGTSTAIAASTILIVHHLFSIYHGDRRLQTRHGLEKFQSIQQQTSVIPFAAILDGRQQLPSDYYKEFLRVPYFVVVGGTMIAYIAHPYMQAGAALLHW
jgi:zeta-carotene isomerase